MKDIKSIVMGAKSSLGGGLSNADRQSLNETHEMSVEALRRVNALSDIVLKHPRYRRAYGNGVINVMDAAAGRIDYIRVESALAGQTLYVQVSNASGMTEEQTEVDENGYATVDLSTVRGENRFYITTQAYAFPPTGNGEHGELNGVYVNPRANENGLSVYDFIRPANSVHALVCCRLDFELYSEIASEIPIEELLAGTGKGVRYVAVETPPSAEYMYDFLYMKMDGYPYGTQANPAYVLTAYPNPDCHVYYVRRFYDLNAEGEQNG